MRRRTEAGGYVLRDRFCVYPEYVTERPEFFDPGMLRSLLEASADDGYPRIQGGES